MEKITKNDLIELGFIENYTSPEEAGAENGYYYYSFEIDGHVLLISNANDECDDNYTIEFFNFIDVIQFNNLYLLKILINLINNATKTK